MEDIQRVRDDFSSVNETQKSVEEIFVSLSKMIESLQALYMDYVERSKDQAENFGVDSLDFQRRYISEERDGLKKLFAMVNNQIYKDHYKLYTNMTKYVADNIDDEKVNDICCPEKAYTVYDDEEPLREYCFEEVFALHHDITSIVSEMLEFVRDREGEAKQDQDHMLAGINIDVFVATEEFNNMAIGSKARLFLEYLKAFNKFHLNYLDRLSTSLRLSHSRILDDLSIKEEQGEEAECEEAECEEAGEYDDEADEEELGEICVLETISEVAESISFGSEEASNDEEEEQAEEAAEEQAEEQAEEPAEEQAEEAAEEAAEEEQAEEAAEEAQEEEHAEEEAAEEKAEEQAEEEAKEEEQAEGAKEEDAEEAEEKVEEAKEEEAEEKAEEAKEESDEEAAEEAKEEEAEETAEEAKEEEAEEAKEEVAEEQAEEPKEEETEEKVEEQSEEANEEAVEEEKVETETAHFSNESSEVVLEVTPAKETSAENAGLTEQQLKWQLKNRERLARRRQKAAL